MVNLDLMLWSMTSVLFFCSGCYFLISSLRERVPVYNRTSFSKKALQVKKAYKVFSWGVLTSFFLAGLVISFAEVFTHL